MGGDKSKLVALGDQNPGGRTVFLLQMSGSRPPPTANRRWFGRCLQAGTRRPGKGVGEEGARGRGALTERAAPAQESLA